MVVVGRLWLLLVLVISFTNQLQTSLLDLLFSISYILLELTSAFSDLSPQSFSLKEFLIFIPKKNFLIFSKKSFSNFQETELYCIFLKKVFLIFRERYMQNHGRFRTRSIFRTLVYSEPEAYSEHCQTSTMECFANIAT